MQKIGRKSSEQLVAEVLLAVRGQAQRTCITESQKKRKECATQFRQASFSSGMNWIKFEMTRWLAWQNQAVTLYSGLCIATWHFEMGCIVSSCVFPILRICQCSKIKATARRQNNFHKMLWYCFLVQFCFLTLLPGIFYKILRYCNHCPGPSAASMIYQHHCDSVLTTVAITVTVTRPPVLQWNYWKSLHSMTGSTDGL
jgi:hypothetical protein